MRDEAFTIQQLATEAQISVSTVRKYVELGLMDPCDGPRYAPIYTNRHLRQLLSIRKSLEGNIRLADLRDIKPYHVIKVAQ